MISCSFFVSSAIFPLAQPAVALFDLGDLLVELLVLLIQPGLVALELGATFAVLSLGRLGDLEGLVLRLEDDLLLLGTRLDDQAFGVSPRFGFAPECELATRDHGDHGSEDETHDEGEQAHDDRVGHTKSPFRAAYAGPLAVSWTLVPVFSASGLWNGVLHGPRRSQSY